jgi:hypothetical protein
MSKHLLVSYREVVSSFQGKQREFSGSLSQFLAAGIVFALFLWGMPAHAQSTYGTIIGTVTDSSGATISDASITLTNEGTAEKRTVQTNASGSYQFVNIVPGQYSLDFEKSGFRRQRRTSITVVVQAALRLDATLAVGDISQTVDVDTSAPIIETQPGALGQLVEGKQVQEMPLSGRNVFNLLILAPGVVPQGSTGGNPLGNQSGGTYTNNTGFGNYQIGGGMANQSAFYLDGVPLNTIYINSPALVPTQDAIQEFRVDSNAVSAEFGRFAGGVVNMASRSGTSTFHGSAYEYIRNRVLNANTFFNKRTNTPTPAFTQNQFGVTLGGPVRRDKLFFFFSWERFSFSKGNPYLNTVPTQAMRNGDFSALCTSFDNNGVCSPGKGVQIYDPETTCGVAGTPGCPVGQTTPRQPFPYNRIPMSRLDVASAQFFKYFGLPNQLGSVSNFLPVNNFASNVKLGGSTNQYNARGDWTVSENQRVFARYSWWSGTSTPSDPFRVNFGGLYSYTGAQNFVVGDTYTFNPHTVADFRLSYLRARNGFTPQQVGTDLSLFGPAWGALTSQVTLPVAPLASISGIAGFSGVDNRSITNDFALSGNLTKILGRHTLKFGGEVRRNDWNFAQSNNAAGSFNFDQGFTAQINPTTTSQIGNTGYSVASFFLGNPASGSAISIGFTDSIKWYPAAYLQDTVTLGNLTVTAGVRWEYNQGIKDKGDRLTVLLPDATDPLGAAVGIPDLKGQMALVNTPLYPGRTQIVSHYKTVAPRVNIAYALDPKTSFRAGYGISWIPPDMVNYSMSAFQSPVNAATTTMVPSVGGTTSLLPAATFADPFPGGLIPPIGHNPAQLGIFEGQSISSPVPSQPFGYAQQWNAEIQRQLTDSMAIDIGYAGSKGTHLSYSTFQLDQLTENQMALGSALNAQVPNPFYGKISSGTLANPTVARAQLLRPYPQFLSFQDTSGSGKGASSWSSLQTRFIDRFKAGGVISASYTWAKLMSNTDTLTSWLETHGAAGVQNWYNLAAEKSLATYDVRHRFVASYVLDLPFGTNKRFLGDVGPVMNRIIGGWSVNGITTLQTGFPLALTTATNQTGSQGGGSRPNVVAGANKKLDGPAQSRLTKWFNMDAFAAPPAFTFGNESRTDSSLRDHGVANWDFTLGKSIPITERVSFTFKTEVFNLFNRVQFGDPGTSVGSSNYGVVSTQINNPRLIQFAGRISF